MRLWLVYDVDLPSRMAAPIQILNTAHALASRGVPTTVAFARVEAADEAQALAPYGLEPLDALSIVALRGGLGAPLRAGGRTAFVRSATEAIAAAGPAGLAVVARGETGARLIPALSALGPARPLLLYEVHRLGWLRLAQDPPAGLGPRVARAWRVPAEWARERRAARAADGVLAISAGLERALRRSLRVERPALVLPSGTRPAPQTGGPRDLDVVYAGKLEVRKGIAVLLEAMGELPDARLQVLGGSEREVAAARALARRAGAADRVTFEGFVAPARVADRLRRARAGACPLPLGVERSAEHFTSSLKALELMAHGVPVVASDVPAMRELLGPARDAALLVAPNDPVALAAGLRRVLGDPALAARLAAAGRARAEDFSWGRRAERLAAFASALAAGRQGGGP